MLSAREGNMKILETERLVLRELEPSDYRALCVILQDPEVMYAYEHAFSDAEVTEWLERQLARYAEYGFGLWAVLRKTGGDMIGQCGITMQAVGEQLVPEVGYLFAKAFWHQGYATEAARACRNWAFETLGADKVYSMIRENNMPSRHVAERNGMNPCGMLCKHYYGIDMPHMIYSVEREAIFSSEKKTKAESVPTGDK